MTFRATWMFCLAAAGAAPQQSVTSVAEPEQPVLRITVNEVQVDAVVTDSHGRQVTTLAPDDFQILEDDRPQKITAFSYVKIAEHPLPAQRKAVPTALPSAPPPSQLLTPQQVRRTIVLMVDDLGLSFESTYYVRLALKKFVDEQMQRGDLVAILRTGAGIGSLQQFTSDKRILHDAIDRVRWFPAGRGGLSGFADMGDESLEDASRLARSSPQANQAPKRMPDLRPPGLDDSRNENFMLGTLGTINFVVRALRDLPGRKALILFSDGIPLLVGGQERTRIVDPMRALTDLANRAAVVVYTIDARGLPTLSLTAADHPALTGANAGPMVTEALSERSQEYLESQDGMRYLARQTGGFFVHSNNDLSEGLRRAVEDLNGYYLLGYKPSESSFTLEKGYRRFHKIQVKVKVPGLNVRSHSGYIGVSDQEARPAHHTGAEQLGAALVSPFRSNDLKLQLTCLFSEVPNSGAVVRSLVHIDASDLTFDEEPGGSYRTVLDIVTFVFDEDGIPLGANSHTGRTATLHFSPADYAQVKQTGLVFRTDVALKKPGAYQVRAAVRDVASNKVGSGSQFIEVPDMTKHHLALSGIVLNGGPPATSGTTMTRQQAENLAIAYSSSPAVRTFHRGQQVRFTYTIFNAQLDKKTQNPNLETGLYLYRDSNLVFTGSVTTLRTAQQLGVDQVIATGAIQLAVDLEPGEYMMEIVARDKLAPGKRQLATQWIDLEVAE